MMELLEQSVLHHLGVEVVHAGPDLHIVEDGPDAGAGLAGRPLTDLVPELMGLEEALTEVASGQAACLEVPMINRSDPAGRGQRYVSLTALPHPQGGGHVMLLVQDRTAEGLARQRVVQQLNETHLLRAQLEAANRKLEELNESKSAFLQMAAHDMKAPLTVIRGYVEWALQEANGALGKEAAEHLGIVLARTQQMAHLIDNLLDVERIELGQTTLHRQPLDLGWLVEDVGRAFATVAEEKGIELRWERRSGLPRVSADWERMVQVLNNLVSNAVKFTPAGGRVQIRAVERRGQLAVEVVDTGPGIPKREQHQLFRRFFRAEQARKQNIPGSGLGLSIVRAIVEQHGGQVYVRSRPGCGSTFGFALPVPDPPV